MSLNIDQIAEAFCGYRFVDTYPYMADEIKWNFIGREELIGREAVIDRCDKSAKFLETVSATITKLKINRAETFVVVEGTAQFLGFGVLGNLKTPDHACSGQVGIRCVF